MSKKIIGLLLVVCLCIGLLPVVALADTPAEVTIAIMSWSNMTVTEGGAPMYAKTVSYEGYTSEGVANGTGWKYTTAGASENDWNIKFEYPLGGVPTLTLKDAKLDQIGDDGTTLYTKSTDSETGEAVYTTTKTCSAILPKTVIDLKIVLEGDNLIEANNGIVRGNVGTSQYFKNITITGDGKLSGTGKAIGISGKSGYTLTIDGPTLNLQTTTSAGGGPIPIRSTNADLIISNANITCGNEQNVAIGAIEGGNVIITDSTINVTSKLTSTAGPGCIYAPKGTVTINGEKTNITAIGQNNSCIYGGNGVIINEGNLKLTSAYYALFIDKANPDAAITVNGGTVEITAERACWAAPVLGSGVKGYAGANRESCEVYDGSNTNLAVQPWMIMSNKELDIVVTEPTIQVPIFTAPTQPATQSTTTAPTQPTTTTPTEKTDDGNTSSLSNPVVIAAIVAAVVIIVGAVVVVVIISKRKKSA